MPWMNNRTTGKDTHIQQIVTLLRDVTLLWGMPAQQAALGPLVMSVLQAQAIQRATAPQPAITAQLAAIAQQAQTAQQAVIVQPEANVHQAAAVLHV